MANEEVLGPRKTMFVLVIVVGCFAVLWPRILSPLLVGHQREQLQPNQFDRDAAIKQERPPIRGAGPHPALRERGRAIPAGAPPAAPQVHIKMPPHVRVRSPLQGYFELDIKPPPIPGMRPPLGSPGGPVPTPKGSMGFVMTLYTMCIIVFFVYTISKLLFNRATIPYEPVTPDPQFRRRVFRDDSRTSPDKLGDVQLEALKARLEETERALQRIVGQLGRRDEDVQDNHTRPYTNGTIIHNTGPVHIIASEYEAKETPAPKEPSPDDKESSPESKSKVALEEVHEEPELEKDGIEEKEALVEKDVPKEDSKEDKHEEIETTKTVEDTKESAEVNDEIQDSDLQNESQVTQDTDVKESSPEEKESTPEKEENVEENNLVDLTEPIDIKRNGDIRTEVEDFLKEEAKSIIEDEKTKELLEEAIGEYEEREEEEREQDFDEDKEKSSVKVMGMEVRAHAADGGAFPSPPAPAPALPPHPPAAHAPLRTPHEAEEVKSIFLETAIPQQSRVLVADCEDHPDELPAHKHSPMVVSGKMTLSLIQDAPRDTPDRDLESTVDDFTTASALTQPAEKDGSDSEEEVEEEEIEIEEIEEEEIEVDEEEEEEEEKPTHAQEKGTE